MSISKGDLAQLTDIQQFLKHAYYRYADFGHEDLPNLIRRALTVMGIEDNAIWGFLGGQLETRPTTMPQDAPTRAYIRGVALHRHRQPNIDLPALFDALMTQITPTDHPIQLLCYGAETWIQDALHQAEFNEVEAVQFFQLDRLKRRLETLPVDPEQIKLAPGRPEHLLELAQLDIAAFPPLWHFGRRDLFEMLIRCRVQLAWQQNEIVGYTAMCANNREEAQLARLAVRPDKQGQGIGRLLLNDAIRFAAQEYRELVLNTQTTNERSQRLYQGYGFKTFGTPVSVLARTLAPAQPVSTGNNVGVGT